MEQLLISILVFQVLNFICLSILFVLFFYSKAITEFEIKSLFTRLYKLENSTKLLIVLLFLASCTTPRSYQFAKYALKTGLDIAEEAGTFKERVFVLPTQYKGDTLIFYEGINKYLLVKKDSTYILTFTPNRKNVQDTCLHFLRKKAYKDEKNRH
jgi:hypothetical protein